METRSRDDCCTTMFALLVAVVLLLVVIVSGRAQEAGMVAQDSLTTPTLVQVNSLPKKTILEPQTDGAWRSPVPNTASVHR